MHFDFDSSSVLSKAAADSLVKKSHEFIDSDGYLYVVNQHKNFKLTDEIWCQVSFTNRDGETQDKVITNMEIITIEICSYVVSLVDIMNFVDLITKEYLESISDSRKNKLFIYYVLNNFQRNMYVYFPLQNYKPF